MPTTPLADIRQLFENNRAWAAQMCEQDPEFFSRLVNQQTPQYLWIGCSDSRVPANTIVGLQSGELFVHRNIANVVVHTDLNCLSVLQFAVDVLRVRHVLVVGHYGCSGVQAALRSDRLGLVDNWLRHVQDVAARHAEELDAIADPAARHDRLCELNVLEQVRNVGRTSVVQDAWARGQELYVHGWAYAVSDGIAKDLGLTLSS